MAQGRFNPAVSPYDGQDYEFFMMNLGRTDENLEPLWGIEHLVHNIQVWFANKYTIAHPSGLQRTLEGLPGPSFHMSVYGWVHVIGAPFRYDFNNIIPQTLESRHGPRALA